MPTIERRRLGVLLTLATLTSMFNLLDRSILNILAEAIKVDLGLSDTQLGLLTGLAFAIFYSAVGLPIARYVDRPTTDRPLVISLCIFVWSLMTMVSGATVNFFQLMIARIMVAIGESGSGPALFTLMNHSVPPKMRGRAFGIYGLGPPLGMLFGLAAGGWLVDLVGWRLTFAIVGAPGLLLALCVKFWIHEPRKDAVIEKAERVPQPTFSETLQIILNTPSLLWLAAAASTGAILVLGQPAWTGVYLIRVLDLEASEAGLILGLSMGLGGVMGSLCGGALGDWLSKDRPGLIVLSPAVGLILGIPAAVIAFTAQDWRVFAVFFWIQAFGLAFYLGPMVARIQMLVPVNCQATSTVVVLMLMSLIGGGLGPLLIGIGSDVLTPSMGREGLRWMMIATSVWAVVPAVLYVRASGWRSTAGAPVPFTSPQPPIEE